MLRLVTSSLALLLAFAVSSLAEAGLIDAEQIVVTTARNPNPSVQIAEVQAFETGTGINVAESANGGSASATSETFGTVAADVIDGNTNGSFGAGSTWHSGNELNAGVTIDLLAATELDSVTIWGRTDCCQDRQNDLTLQIFDGMGTLLFEQQNIDLQATANQSLEIALPDTAPVPEPASIAIWSLIGFVLAGFGYYRVRHKK